MKVEYHPALATELLQIRDYYEAQSPGLGAQFVDEFERRVLAGCIKGGPDATPAGVVRFSDKVARASSPAS